MDELAQGQTADAVVKGRLEVATCLVQGDAQKEGGGERDRVDLSIVSRASKSHEQSITEGARGRGARVFLSGCFHVP